MRQDRIYNIIQRLADNITDEQRQLVWYWIIRHRNDADTETVMERIWDEASQFSMDDPGLEQSLYATMHKIQLRKNSEQKFKHAPVRHKDRKPDRKFPEKRKRTYWLVAACLVLLVASSLLIVLNNSSSHYAGAGAFIGKTMPLNDIQLISGKNVLTLAQDAQITLNDEGKVSLISEQRKSEIVLPEDEMNRLIVPYGKRSTLQLADGTKVWMNSGTELEFPSEFDGNTRDIVLKGEIYIEVAKMEKKPFYVHTAEFTVQVLGTRFNVSAYPDNKERTIVLVEGEVEVSTIRQGTGKLAPDEMFTIDTDGIRKQKAEVSKYICWKDGFLILNKTPISDVLQKIGRYYNVSFDDHSDEVLFSKTCTGKLYLSENLDEVLMSIAILSRTEYHKHNGIIYIRNQVKIK